MADLNEILNRFEQDEHGQAESPLKGKKLRVGIIGTGWIAEAHMISYLKIPEVEIVAGADLVPGKAKAFFERFGLPNARCYESHQELLAREKLDCVSVCTYNCTHAECTIDALRAGVHVLLEKPMCVTLEEALAIRRAERESGKLLSIGFQPRFDRNMMLVKRIVQSGTLGKVYYIQTGGGRRRGIPTPYGTSFIAKETGGIGALGDIGCYSLDLVLNAIGYPKPLTVTGYTSDFFGKQPSTYPTHPEYAQAFGVDDFAAAFVRLDDGCVLDFRIAWAMNIDSPGDTIFLGTKGGLRVAATDCWNGSFEKPLRLYQEIAGEQVETVIPLVKSDDKETLFDQKIRYFLEAAITNGPSPVPSSQIIRNQAIIDGINRSARSGREVSIEIPEE